MNILLVYPEFPDTFWSFKYALPFVGKRATLPPLGLLTVAAMLPSEWSVRLVDTNVRKLTRKHLAWADLVCISAMVVQRESAGRIIDRCKAAGCCVVAGGPLFTSEHARFPTVDHFVLNEAEVTLPLFLADLARGQVQRLYASNEFADLHESPAPRWELLELKRYANMSIQFSRGCPFNCDFCNITTLLGHRVRIKSAAQIVRELDGLYDLGWRGDVFFVDDNFIGNQPFLKREILPALTAWRKGKRGNQFFTESSINLADDYDLMDRMVEAGFNLVFVGIETPDERALAECSKVQNRCRDLVEDVKRLQRAGLQVQGGFIVGFDSDSTSTFQRQIDFIQQSGIVTAMVGLLQAPPGTRLFDRMQKEQRLCAETSGDNMDGTTNIVPTMGLATLQKGYHRVLNHIYAPAPYYRRIRTFLREYHPTVLHRCITRSQLRGVLKSLVILGVFGRERLHFWRLLAWTRSRCPQLLPEAITLAVYGYHFRKTCEKHVAYSGNSIIPYGGWSTGRMSPARQ